MQQTFTIEQKKLLGILSSMQPICAKKTALQATASILFQLTHREIILKSTDLEISLQASCELIESSISEPHSFIVSGRKIFEIVKELEGSIKFSVDDQKLNFHTESVNLSLHIKDAQEFPPFPERIENIMELDASLLLKMLDSVGFLIPQNNTNSALNGLLCEINEQHLTMTTTDGHCLAQIKTDKATIDGSHTWLLPRRAVFELKKVLETCKEATIFLGTCGNQLVFSGDFFNFFTNLLADSFPQYQSILNKDSFIPARVEKTRLVKTLRRSVCLLSGHFIATHFHFSNDSMTVSLNNKEVGTFNEEIPLNIESDISLDVNFYAPYILSGLQSITGSDVHFYLKNSSKPIIFESLSDNYNLTYLVMPVSKNSNQ
jgi:DNA polymerase-3 subunit beta